MTEDLSIASAAPRKQFFIDMLIRDIPLQRAILDVIDNSIDAAITSLGGDNDLSQYYVNIIINKDKFVIIDNCGGMSRNTARLDAFTFGKTTEQIVIKASRIGNFGVGMKRTIFKLGRYFRFLSSYDSDSFHIEQDIDDWISKPDLWQFQIKDGLAEVKEKYSLPAQWKGVIIEVTRLNENVAIDFESHVYTIQLIKEVEMFLSYFLTRGIQININGTPLSGTRLKLFSSEIFPPSIIKHSILGGPMSPRYGAPLVSISIVIGLSEREKWDGGWYIYCNNRMIVKADQSEITGWGKNQPLGRKYHETYAYFRGIVFFESTNGDLLPWTTTKIGLNTDSSIYKNALSLMTKQAIPVLSFLDSVANQRSKIKQMKDVGPQTEEYDNILSYGEVLDKAAQDNELAPLNLSNYTEKITFPNLSIPAFFEQTKIRIQYSVGREIASKVKNHLEVSSFASVGLQTFMAYAVANDLIEEYDDE